ncbi:Acetyltransferase (GNAT) family protein [Flavobacteriaceae bacterium MAR_2010_188]|nr:Acetyltransferase (GNAT) family protein [Flavobacteriaceae bacterium MAR_2010_188]
MTVHNLSATTFDEIVDCFLESFENYFVQMPTDQEYYKQRWNAAKVDFELSYGMFENGELIGFIIHAIDKRNGILTAFNTGTGVLPNYRGKKIVNTIYDYAIKDLAENGIEKCTLEVITQNKFAIKSYEKTGFKITKTLKCFNGTIEVENNDEVKLTKVELDQVNWEDLPNQEFYSWDNQKESLINSQLNFYKVLYKEKAESYFIINSENGYLAQLDLLENSDNAWERLFSRIKQISATVKFNNVDEQLTEKIRQLKKVGLINTIDQYEMELDI